MNQKKQLKISKTVYPLDYNKNNPKTDSAFNHFHQHIRNVLLGSQVNQVNTQAN